MTRVAIIAGALPLTEPQVFAQLPAIDRTYTRLSQRAPWAARMAFRAMGLAARTAPRWYGGLAARQLGPADADVLRETDSPLSRGYRPRHFVSPTASSRTIGPGCGRGDSPPRTCTFRSTCGAASRTELIDASWPRELARRIPGAVLRMRAGGHFLAHLHYREIFDDLTR